MDTIFGKIEKGCCLSVPKDLKALLSDGRLCDAINMLRSKLEKKMQWELSDELNKIEEAYRYLLQYTLDGAADPSRQKMLEDLTEKIVILYNRHYRYPALSKTAQYVDTIYNNTLHHNGGGNLTKAIGDYRDALSSTGSFVQAMTDAPTDIKAIESTEQAERDMFDAIWVRYPITPDDSAAVTSLLTDQTIPTHAKRLAISALMLGTMEYYDESRLTLLLRAYRDIDDPAISLPALTSLILLLYLSKDNKLSARFEAELASVKESDNWRSDVRSIFLEFLRTRDTERITRELTDEIAPTLISLKPELEKKFGSNIQRLDVGDLDENPEWQEILEESGIADKIKELSELQEEGSDVMMGTFAHLKSYPFFYSPANWFLPFYTDHSVVVRLGDMADVISEIIAQAAFICDSDKYSFILALSSMPEQQRNMMLSQFKEQNVNLAEIQKASLNLSTDTRRNIVNKYVQDLYRFFRLFRRKDDFYDPFDKEINIAKLEMLRDDLSDVETLQLAAEFYFKRKYYYEALSMFKIIEEMSVPDALLYQKMGYAHQKLKNIGEALGYYEKAELLNGASAWVIKHIAQCHSLIGHAPNALSYYNRLLEMQPENVSTLINIAHNLLRLDRYDEAIKTLYKANYLSNESLLTRRLLAWALTLGRQDDRAEELYSRLLTDPEVSADDYLNAGHLALLRRDYHLAVNRYKEFISRSENNPRALIDAMRSDANSLKKAGVEPDKMPLVFDATLYSLGNISYDPFENRRGRRIL